MADEALDTERLEEIARGFEGYPTPVDHRGKCWFCNGGLGHGPSGHAESCIWVHRDDLGEGVAELRARLEAAEQERDDARRWAVRLEQGMFSERDAAYKLLLEAYSSPYGGSPSAKLERDTLRARAAAAEARSVRLAEVLREVFEYVCRLEGATGYLLASRSKKFPEVAPDLGERIRAALAEHDAAKGEG